MRDGVGPVLIAGLGVLSAVFGWLITRIWYARAGIPPSPSWLAAVLVVVAAGAVIALARPVRAASSADPPRSVAPRRAVVALALAQAAAVTGAALAGWNVGFLLTLAGDLDAASVRAAAGAALALVAAAVALVIAGVWAQNACRLPPRGASPAS